MMNQVEDTAGAVDGALQALIGQEVSILVHIGSARVRVKGCLIEVSTQTLKLQSIDRKTAGRETLLLLSHIAAVQAIHQRPAGMTPLRELTADASPVIE